MAEKITNGAFSSSLSGWSNIGAYNFYWYPSRARAISLSNSKANCIHTLQQSFGVTGSVQSALLSALGIWNVADGDEGGNVTLQIKLVDPDSVTTTLVDKSYSTGGDSGSEMIADSLDISSYMTKVGTYKLQLIAMCSSSRTVIDPGPPAEYSYDQSVGEQDSISLLVTERFTKTVLEIVGGGEEDSKAAQASATEQAGLAESYSTIGGGFFQGKFEVAGVQEGLEAAVSVARLEQAGLAETLVRTYGYRQRDVPGGTELAGISESLTAVWETGNFINEREILEEEDIWEDIPKVSTGWENS